MKKLIVCVLLSATLLTACSTNTSNSESSQIEEMQNTITEMEERISELETQNSDLEYELEDANIRLDDIELKSNLDY